MPGAVAPVELGLTAALIGAIAAPHLIPLERVAPRLASAVWLLTLALRALMAIGGAVFVFSYLPRTHLFAAMADWCWHEVLPLLATHLGLSGHPFVHAAVILPALVLAGSLAWLAVGLARAWLALRRQLRRSLGHGPEGSTVVADERVVVAATALGRGRIVVSPAALTELDPGELSAGLAHERGHLQRQHRPLLLLGSLLAALARALPGTGSAQRELVFHLERDADEFALDRTADPLALASAICKAAGAPSAAASLGGRGGVTRRLGLLVDGSRRGGPLLHQATATLALALAVLTVGLAASLPAWATAEPVESHLAPAPAPCHG